MAERFVKHCNGQITYVQGDITYRLQVSVLDEDFITVNVATIPYECSNDQVKTFFSSYGEIARVVTLNHASNLLFPVYSGRRLVIFKKIHTNIPQHLELGGHKIRVIYDSQIKVCAA